MSQHSVSSLAGASTIILEQRPSPLHNIVLCLLPRPATPNLEDHGQGNTILGSYSADRLYDPIVSLFLLADQHWRHASTSSERFLCRR